MALLELYGRQVASGVVATPGVIEHLDVAEDIDPSLIARRINLSANALSLEQLEEALCDCVVMAVAAPAHAAHQVVVAQEALPVMAGELGGMHGDRRFGLLAISAVLSLRGANAWAAPSLPILQKPACRRASRVPEARVSSPTSGSHAAAASLATGRLLSVPGRSSRRSSSPERLQVPLEPMAMSVGREFSQGRRSQPRGAAPERR